MIRTASCTNSDTHTHQRLTLTIFLPLSDLLMGRSLSTHTICPVLAIFLMSAMTFFSCLSNFPLSLSSSLERGRGGGRRKRRKGRGREEGRRKGEKEHVNKNIYCITLATDVNSWEGKPPGLLNCNHGQPSYCP